jgi:hypothetical protein
MIVFNTLTLLATITFRRFGIACKPCGTLLLSYDRECMLGLKVEFATRTCEPCSLGETRSVLFSMGGNMSLDSAPDRTMWEEVGRGDEDGQGKCPHILQSG